MAPEVIPLLKSRCEVKPLASGSPRLSRVLEFGSLGKDGEVSFPSSLQLACTSQSLLVHAGAAQLSFLLRRPSIEFSDSTDLDFYKNFIKKNSVAEQSCVCFLSGKSGSG